MLRGGVCICICNDLLCNNIYKISKGSGVPNYLLSNGIYKISRGFGVPSDI